MLALLLQLLRTLPLLFGFLRSRKSYPKPLSAQKEAEALKRMQEGDRQAREELIEHNLRLVAHVAKKYQGSGVEMDDLLSTGSLGLMKAVDSFRPQTGSALSTYAARCVENEILMLLRKRRKWRNEVSLNEVARTDKEGNELYLNDLMGTDPDEVHDTVQKGMEKALLFSVLEKVLTPRERLVLCARYGLDGSAPLAQKIVAQNLGISRSYVSRIESRAIEKLQAALAQEEK